MRPFDPYRQAQSAHAATEPPARKWIGKARALLSPSAWTDEVLLAVMVLAYLLVLFAVAELAPFIAQGLPL